MTSDVFVTAIVTLEFVDDAAAEHEGGAGMFVVPVYQDDELYGYISSGYVSEDIYNTCI